MKNLLFRQAYLTLPRVNKQHICLRDQILNECQVSRATFYNWIKCITNVPEHHRIKIANILGKSVEELFN